MFESGVINFGGQMFGVSAPKFVQSFFALLACLIMVRLLINAFKAFKEARKENCVFSREEVKTFISSQMQSIQNILEDGGIDYNDRVAFQWLLYLCRKIRVRQRIVLVDHKRYEAAGFTKMEDFWKKADLRLGESCDVCHRMEDGTPIWQKTETLRLAQDVLADAKGVAQHGYKRRMSLPTEYHKFRREENGL